MFRGNVLCVSLFGNGACYFEDGNVKYVFAGHIHNSTKVSVRSARNYKGTNYVVCPTHVWYQRPFGKNQKYPEEFAQQNHGFIIGYLKGNKAE